MILLDSNIFIYAALPEHIFLREMMRKRVLATSMVSRIEVLGYHRMTLEQADFLERLLDMAELLSLSFPIAERAVLLRQQRRMSLGDAIVAATALEYGMPLWTRNSKDFSWVVGLVVHDPFNNISAVGGSPAQSTETE